MNKQQLRRYILMDGYCELFEMVNPSEISSRPLREAFLRMQTSFIEGRKVILELTRPPKRDRRAYVQAIQDEGDVD